MEIKKIINNIVNLAKHQIEILAKTNLNNNNKKKALDSQIRNYIDNILNTVSINFILRFIIKKIFIPIIPDITQIIYDLIKVKVEGVTKWWI